MIEILLIALAILCMIVAVCVTDASEYKDAIRIVGVLAAIACAGLSQLAKRKDKR